MGVATYDSGRDASSTDQLALLAELRDALAADDQIVLALQPAVDLETARADRGGGADPLAAPAPRPAAARRFHPDDRAQRAARAVHPLRPGPVAGRGRGLDRRPASTLPVSVNVSARSLLDPTFPAQIADPCAGTGWPPASWSWRSPSRWR